MGNIFIALSLAVISGCDTNVQATKDIKNRWIKLHENEKQIFLKDNINKVKRQLTEWEEICKLYFNKRLITEYI